MIWRPIQDSKNLAGGNAHLSMKPWWVGSLRDTNTIPNLVRWVTLHYQHHLCLLFSPYPGRTEIVLHQKKTWAINVRSFGHQRITRLSLHNNQLIDIPKLPKPRYSMTIESPWDVAASNVLHFVPEAYEGSEIVTESQTICPLDPDNPWAPRLKFHGPWTLWSWEDQHETPPKLSRCLFKVQGYFSTIFEALNKKTEKKPCLFHIFSHVSLNFPLAHQPGPGPTFGAASDCSRCAASSGRLAMEVTPIFVGYTGYTLW